MNRHGWIQLMNAAHEEKRWHDQDFAVIIHGPLSIFAGDAAGPLPGPIPLPREPALNDWTGTAVLTVSVDGWPEEPASSRTWQPGVPSARTWSGEGQDSPTWTAVEATPGGFPVSPSVGATSWSAEAAATPTSPAWGSASKGSPTWTPEAETDKTWTPSTAVEKSWSEAT